MTPREIRLHVIDVGENLRVFDARSFPAELVWNGQVFEAAARRSAGPMFLATWVFSDDVLRAMAALPVSTQADLAKRFRPRGQGPDVIYVRPGALDDDAERRLGRIAEVGRPQVVTPTETLDVPEILRRVSGERGSRGERWGTG